MKITQVLLILTVTLLLVTLQSYAQDESDGMVNGSISGSDGSMVSGALVKLAGGETTNQMVTTENGWYQFVNVSPGNYQISVSAAGYEAENASVTVNSDETVKTNLTLKAKGIN